MERVITWKCWRMWDKFSEKKKRLKLRLTACGDEKVAQTKEDSVELLIPVRHLPWWTFFHKATSSTETTLAVVVNWFTSSLVQLLLLKSKKMSSIKMAGLAFHKKPYQTMLRWLPPGQCQWNNQRRRIIAKRKRHLEKFTSCEKLALSLNLDYNLFYLLVLMSLDLQIDAFVSALKGFSEKEWNCMEYE